jgi:hypothetical protein
MLAIYMLYAQKNNREMKNMQWSAKLVDPEDAEWIELVDRVTTDVYHTPEYLRLCAIEEEGDIKVILFKRNGSVVGLPLFISNLGNGDNGKDAASPYGYPGVVGDLVDVEDWKSVFSEMMVYFSELGFVSVFLRFHPLLTSGELIEAISDYGEVICHGETVYQNIDVDKEVLWSETRPRIRTEINKLRNNGWAYVPDDWTYIESFCENYNMTMRRVNASEKYYFSARYYDFLKEMQKNGSVSLHTVIDRTGAPATSGLFFRRGGIVQYHLGGTHDLYIKDAPAKLLFHEVRLWYRRKHAKIIHYGGGLGGQNDSLFQFKSGFSKKRAKFFTAQFIIDKNKYGKLVEIRIQSLKAKGEKLKTNYFPEYRAPGM